MYWLALDGLWPTLNAVGQGIQLPFIRIYGAPTMNLGQPVDIVIILANGMGCIIHDSLTLDLIFRGKCVILIDL